MVATTGADVASLLDRSSEAAFVAVCNHAVEIARALCSAYTRGRGFADGTGTSELETVVRLVAIRYATNPENLRAEQLGDYKRDMQVIDGFTLAEQVVLNRYRRRAR